LVLPFPGTLGREEPNRLLRDRDGVLWVGGRSLGLLHGHGHKTDPFTPVEGLASNEVQDLFEDREGTLWVASLEGLDRFHDRAVAQVTVRQGLSSPSVNSVIAAKDGSVWLATNGGLNRWQRGAIDIPSTGSTGRDGTLAGLRANSLFQDRRGRIVVSTN